MKRSILFGVLAMFAVSALSVQNLNAQNEEKVGKTTQATSKEQPKSSTNAINEPKDKPQASEEANTKGNSGVQKDAQEPEMMRDMQKPQGEKNVSVQKEGKKQDVMDRTSQNPKGEKNVSVQKEG